MDDRERKRTRAEDEEMTGQSGDRAEAKIEGRTKAACDKQNEKGGDKRESEKTKEERKRTVLDHEKTRKESEKPSNPSPR